VETLDTAEMVTGVRPYCKTRSLARTGTQIEKGRELRHTPTEAEQAAWYLLRGIKFKGFKFRRQHPVGPYVVDFYCAQRRLVVELDGSVHGQPRQGRRDARRDAHLKSMGYTVLRFSNGIIQKAPELFVQKVWDAVWSMPEAFG
jgi:very-short-patch-repair endonuclease